MTAENGRGNLKLSSARMGMWKDAVSIAQRARKKRYWSRMGWEESRFDGPALGSFGVAVWEVVLVRPEVKGGGGVRGRAGDEGVAFSIRAHVR